MADRRRRAGLDLCRAAARLGISPRYLRSIERGRVPLSWRLANRMVSEYGTRLADLTQTGGTAELPATGRGEGAGD